MVAVVIPAHNEERVLGRLLSSLASLDGEVVVVANGCTDGTVAVARAHGVRVVESPRPSKAHALALGDAAVTSFPRLYLDADVVLTPADVGALVTALEAPDVHAAAPARELPMAGVSWPVRAYYALWQHLPAVRSELFGRGVIAVDAVGHERVRDWPDVMSDDLRLALSFAPGEVRVVEQASVVVHPPRHYRDLLRRRVRAMSGNVRLRRQETLRRPPGAGLRYVARLVQQDLRLAPAAGVFVLTAVLAKAGGRWTAARGGDTWLRDESSRSLPAT